MTVLGPLVDDPLTPPFFLSEHGDADIDIFPTLEAMAGFAEVYDLAVLDFFDARGRQIRAIAEGYTVKLSATDPPVVEPGRLEELLRRNFSVLPPQLASFSEAASKATTLDELVQLRRMLEERPKSGLWARLLRLIGRPETRR